ncbi:MAG: transposase [Acidimicrobiia bacterium]
MTEAVDSERRELIAGAKIWGLDGPARDLKKTMWVLRKGRENLRDHERERLASLVKTNGSLYRAYILKELLRRVFSVAGDDGVRLLQKWLVWARRCRITHVVKVAKRISAHIHEIEAALLLRVSTSRSEALNAKIQVIIRRSYGFHSAQAVIALAFLCLGGVCPPLPRR